MQLRVLTQVWVHALVPTDRQGRCRTTCTTQGEGLGIQHRRKRGLCIMNWEAQCRTTCTSWGGL